ncbi:MAG: hypothetical protein HC781_09525 [Leptolyngbyaceae cyanobacterium CSU_1_4]|nr:hypothetical protein [Leptolyngbyaceae cyanobacterium CSU_1_4]
MRAARRSAKVDVPEAIGLIPELEQELSKENALPLKLGVFCDEIKTD